jgi:hypothetical protein
MSDTTAALRACYSALSAAHETMQGILAGKTKLRKEEWEVIEPIHAEAMRRAEEALDEMDAIKYESEEPLQIKRWISSGEFDVDDIGNVSHVYEQAGGLLDHACASEIFGTVLFEGANGKYYTISVEGVLGEANPEWVKEMLADADPEDIIEVTDDDEDEDDEG